MRAWLKGFSVVSSLALLLMLIAGCAQKPVIQPVAWQQQLALPAVQQVVAATERLPEQVNSITFDWFDLARNRSVPALLFLPAKQSAQALVVFSHGLGGSKERYAYLGQYWASQGYASLHVQHDGSDRKVWRGSRLLLPFRLREAANDTEALARVQDVSFALDQLQGLTAYQRLITGPIIMAGHSYGANTAMLLSGAVVKQDGQLLSLKDERISAAILISAPPFYNRQPLSQVLSGVTLPTLHITTLEDEITVPGYYSAPADRVKLYYAMASRYKVLAVFSGGSHNVFSGWRRSDDSPSQKQVIKAATQTLSSAFIKQVLTGNDQALQLWAQQHQSVLADFIRSDTLAAVD